MNPNLEELKLSCGTTHVGRMNAQAEKGQENGGLIMRNGSNRKNAVITKLEVIISHYEIPFSSTAARAIAKFCS